jgi:uncharacterized protein (TIGR03663 family)
MKWMPILFLLILAAALGLRLPHLASRPMHHDEANQAARFGILLEQGTYTYDADDHHGPTLYYLTLPIAKLTGAQTFADTRETTYRTLPVLFGMLLILCTPLIRDGLGSIAVLTAALLTAISPAMAYYSRFYIQEMLFVFFTFLTIAAGWRSWQYGSRNWAILCGLFAGLMFATKETAIIAYAAMFGAALLCGLMDRKAYIPLKNMALAMGCAGLVAFVLFSSFLTNWDGPLESIMAFKGYFARGTGLETDHVHPWNFYLKMLTYYRFEGGPVWSEGLIFGLGLIGGLSVLLKKLPSSCNLGLARFLLFYTLLLTLAYSALSYKTPWCILSFLHGWILLAGMGAVTLFDGCRNAGTKHDLPPLRQLSNPASVLSIVLILLLAYPAFTTFRLAQRTVFRYAADYRNPYVYAHTVPDFMNLIRRIREMEAISPKGRQLYIQVVADPKEMWPLPFYLRKFPNVGYWINATAAPSSPKPDIIIASPDFTPAPNDYLSEYYGLRPDHLLAIHIDAALWKTFIEDRR